MRAALPITFSLLSLLVLPGCSCQGPRPRPDGGRGDGGGSTETGGQCGDGLDNDGDGLNDCADPDCAPESRCTGFDAGMRRDTGFEECTGIDFNAETRNAPIDIIWVIDNSGSMDEEASEIQMRLNSFVSAIGSAGIEDYHVVVVTMSGFVSVPAPLGTDPTRFRFVDTNVQSSDSFDRILEQVPTFMDFLRPEAITHFVFVTDDQSAMGASEFEGRMRTLLGGRSFTGHAIASPPGSRHCPPPPFPCFVMMDGCTGPGGEAAGNGDEYWSLATSTGGLQLSICANDWGVLFGQLLDSVAVPMPLPCRFDIPEPPEGMTFQSNLVNVVYTPSGGGVPQTIPRSASGDCLGDGFTWVYDDPANPTEILLCTSACGTVESDPTGAVRIQLGCESLLE